MTPGSLTERITRSLAYMLRHQPEDFDLELDAHGFAEFEDVVRALNERLGEPIHDEDVLEAIESGDRPRYQVTDDKIRALYGHSFPIDPGEPSEPPELLYVGVGSRDAGRATRHDLRGGRRAFLHLALTFEDAVETGRRIAPEYAVITVRAKQAHDDGVEFFDRHSLFLAEAIPTDYIEVGEVRHDGILRDDSHRGGRRAPQEKERARPARSGSQFGRGVLEQQARGSARKSEAKISAEQEPPLEAEPLEAEPAEAEPAEAEPAEAEPAEADPPEAEPLQEAAEVADEGSKDEGGSSFGSGIY